MEMKSMRWIPDDIAMFNKSSEYVDTAVVPLLPVAFGEGMKESAAMTEFAGILTSQLERQLQGRILLIPGYTYLKSKPGEAVSQLEKWEAELLDRQFKHVFYVTCDYDWKQREGELRGTVLWLPSLPLEQMNEASKVSVMEDQVRQLMNLFIQKWREEE
ncbi:YpiF family protein [Bacillus sp. FJAT-27251]|uniref:YpiF family protein n=1 Tax=Bacillus sp. FJAT-27251 TaxID=1684142 RepID=UPI001E62129C|nr:YpiF family protein [Bacillus sp. FJAT-27251]